MAHDPIQAAENYEKRVRENLATLASEKKVPHEAAATAAHAMATLAVANRLDALYALLAERLPRRS